MFPVAVPLKNFLSPSGMGRKTSQTMAEAECPEGFGGEHGGIMGKGVEFAEGLGVNLDSATGLFRGPL